MHPNLRRHERITQKIKFDLYSDELLHQAESLNLSLNGVYCKVDKPIAFMTRVKLTLLLPDKTSSESVETFECHGVVVRTDQIENSSNKNDDNFIAIFFDKIEDEEQQKLANYLDCYHSRACLKRPFGAGSNCD